MDPSAVLELNAFVPAKNFDLCKQFYSYIGFEMTWSSGEIAKFKVGTFTFLLQKFYVQQHAENFMMNLWWRMRIVGGRTSSASGFARSIRTSCSSRRRCSRGAFASYTSRIRRACCGTSRIVRAHDGTASKSGRASHDEWESAMATIPRTARTCPKGHRFQKSSDCPVCPICEAERKPTDGFLSELNAPARRALERAGITTLTKLARYTENEILQLHGMGPATMPKLRASLRRERRSFRPPRKRGTGKA